MPHVLQAAAVYLALQSAPSGLASAQHGRSAQQALCASLFYLPDSWLLPPELAKQVNEMDLRGTLYAYTKSTNSHPHVIRQDVTRQFGSILVPMLQRGLLRCAASTWLLYHGSPCRCSKNLSTPMCVWSRHGSYRRAIWGGRGGAGTLLVTCPAFFPPA